MSKVLNGVHALIADDNAITLMIMAQVLTEAGAVVTKAVNGRDVLEKLELIEADILLMDIQMPELDGLTAALVIRHSGQRYSKIPIIAITAESSSEEAEKALNAGMNDFIVKPVLPAVLLQKMEELLKGTQEIIETSVAAVETEKPLFDLTYLRDITRGQPEQLIVIAENFIANAPVMLQESADAVAVSDWKTAAEVLHKLKGLAGLFYMPVFTSDVKAAEQYAKAAIPDKQQIENTIISLSEQLPVLSGLIKEDIKK